MGWHPRSFSLVYSLRVPLLWSPSSFIVLFSFFFFFHILVCVPTPLFCTYISLVIIFICGGCFCIFHMRLCWNLCHFRQVWCYCSLSHKNNMRTFLIIAFHTHTHTCSPIREREREKSHTHTHENIDDSTYPQKIRFLCVVKR